MSPWGNPIAETLGRALLHFLWQGAAIAALLRVMLIVLRHAPAQTRYAAACAAMLAMVASFAFTAAAPSPVGASLTLPVFAPWEIPHASAAGGARGAEAARWGDYAVTTWLVGVGLLLVRRVCAWLSARRLACRASVEAAAIWTELLDRLRDRMGLARAVRLVESALVESPAVIGWLRPVILAPAGWLMGLAPEQAEAVLLHELAHVRRHDYLINLLQSVVEDVLFYHPAVWWVGRVIRRERENCCDDAAIALGADRKVYVRTLAALEGMRTGEPALAASGGNLASRIRRLVRPSDGVRVSPAPLLLVMLLVCGGAAALPAWETRTADEPVAAEVPAPVPAPQQQTPASRPAASPYQKWLTEDVAYIIRDDERAAFRRLQTDEEREKFIEQFWARRDPTPSTVQNEFKEEHYRRIAYANQHFAESVAGWKTDRGRIYITYGPPDEKEVHPTGEKGGPPYEEWLYKHIDGIGDKVIVRFEDEQRNGDFHQTRDPKAPQVVKPGAAVAVPRVQPNSDYVYSDGPLSVRLGENGAALITVAGSGAQVTLRRIARHTPDLVFRERSGDQPYSKLISLPAGTYQLEGTVEQRQDQAAEMQRVNAQLMTLQERLNSQLTTYRQTHPAVQDTQHQIALQQDLLNMMKAARERQTGQNSYRVEFRVP